ncbi:hypothetical protein [Atopomonas sediminilitoris]|uniref:hypothetical protein n=1 Tax=Atopomonas sediminilitoris TaxID=2919919 RepID=UPI001F4E7B3A|nr:hypothetical protein [Atopomonas sediminilitoris]MCJ8168966.1 hypothetical protein [Atopomonas sediminilitoris]
MLRYLAAALIALCLSTNVVAAGLSAVAKCSMPGSLQAAQMANQNMSMLPASHSAHHAGMQAGEASMDCCQGADSSVQTAANADELASTADDGCPMGLDCQPVHSVLLTQLPTLHVFNSPHWLNAFNAELSSAPVAALLRPPQH